jgi:hypothetical protein
MGIRQPDSSDFVPISKQKKERRKELAHFRTAKCSQHNMKGCSAWRCQFTIRERYYRRGKKIQKVKSASSDRLETLFQSLRHPVVDPTPIDPRKMTLRERIELSKSAA